jgi:hypothetical protein
MKDELVHFGRSFIISRKFIMIFAVEFFFVLLLYSAFSGWLFGIEYFSGAVSDVKNSITDSNDISQLVPLAETFKSFVFYLVLFSVIFTMLFLVLWAVSRMVSWNYLLRKKSSAKQAFKLMLLKFCWVLLWLPVNVILIVLFFAAFSALSANPLIAPFVNALLLINIAVFLITAYFGLFLYHSFFVHDRMFFEAFRKGFKAFPKMFFPLVLSAAAFFVWWLVIIVLAYLNLAYLLVDAFLFLYVFCAVKIYLIEKTAEAS